MIYIREVVPRKFSGLSSFLITFPFNEKIIDAVKSLPASYFLTKEKAWEVPSSCLADALDTLTYYDDIQLIMMPELEDDPNQDDFKLTQAEIDHFRFTPFPHQIDGINFGLNPKRTKWLLLDSMGLGKTLEIIGYAETLKRRGLIQHCMIICGVDSLRQNWKHEIQKFSTESVLVLGEKVNSKGTISYDTIVNRAKILKEPISEFFVIINAATLRHDEVIDALKWKKNPNHFGLIAVDEAHRFTTDSSQGTNLLKLDAPYKVAATGTLLLNSPISCYLPLAWTDNDHAILTNFKAQYCTFGGFGGKQIVGYQNLDTLKEEIQSCMIRRTLEQVRSDMPLKNITYELLEMDSQHRKFYSAIVDGVKEEADKIKLNKNNLLALTTRLRQASVCPSILTTQEIQSTKITRAVEIAQDLIDQGEKVVIFSAFKEPLYVIAKMLEQYNPLLGTGDFTEQQVQDRVDRFQEDPSAKLFLGTHSRMGTGFTLNSAGYMICLDTPYTDAAFGQSTDRIWRITNKMPAFVTVLTCEDTIDERVREIVETKKELSDYIIDGKENGFAMSDGLADALTSILRSL